MNTVAHFEGGPLNGEVRVIPGDAPLYYECTQWLGESERDSDKIRVRTVSYRRVHLGVPLPDGHARYEYGGMR